MMGVDLKLFRCEESVKFRLVNNQPYSGLFAIDLPILQEIYTFNFIWIHLNIIYLIMLKVTVHRFYMGRGVGIWFTKRFWFFSIPSHALAATLDFTVSRIGPIASLLQLVDHFGPNVTPLNQPYRSHGSKKWKKRSKNEKTFNETVI